MRKNSKDNNVSLEELRSCVVKMMADILAFKKNKGASSSTKGGVRYGNLGNL